MQHQDLVYPHSLNASRTLDADEKALIVLGRRRLLVRTVLFCLAYPLSVAALTASSALALSLVQIRVPPLYAIFLAAPIAAAIAVALTRSMTPRLAEKVAVQMGVSARRLQGLLI